MLARATTRKLDQREEPLLERKRSNRDSGATIEGVNKGYPHVNRGPLLDAPRSHTRLPECDDDHSLERGEMVVRVGNSSSERQPSNTELAHTNQQASSARTPPTA